MFFTSERSFRKLFPNNALCSRTALLKAATDVRWVGLKTINPRYGAHSRRTTMLRKLTFALVAATSLGAAALAPTAASASPFWHPHHHLHGHGFVGGGYGYYGHGGEGCYRTRLVPTKFGYRYRVINVCAW